MITILEHTNLNTAKAIRTIFQMSYAIEAKLLNADYFPPLHREIKDFTNCENIFYGHYKNNILTAVAEIKHEDKTTHIQSLVVHPNFFKQGIAQELIKFIFKSFHPEMFTVETGADNIPACCLYEKMGFSKTSKWMTKHNIIKVSYEKTPC